MKKELVFSIFIVLAVFAAGCAAKPAEAPPEQEEFVDTGVLVIESSPGGADVFVNNKLEGQTPLTLYNFPVGQYEVRLEKEGYASFGKTASVRVGATEEIDAKLDSNKKDEPGQKVCPAVCMTVYVLSKGCAVNECGSGCGGDGIDAFNSEEECRAKLQQQQANKISLSSFAMYYDFENGLFTSLRGEKSDAFSRKYDSYVDFVALSPGKMEIIKKPLKEVSKSDCINTAGGVAQLFSGDTLCVVTIEGNFFAVSGSWEKTPAELDFVRLS